MTKLKKAKLIIILTSLTLLAIVIFQNTNDITTTVLFAKVTMPQAFLLFLTFVFGALIGFITAFLRVNQRIVKGLKQINDGEI